MGSSAFYCVDKTSCSALKIGVYHAIGCAASAYRHETPVLSTGRLVGIRYTSRQPQWQDAK